MSFADRDREITEECEIAYLLRVDRRIGIRTVILELGG